jgi:Dna[CI] antecedent DciA-like protein
MVRSPQLVSRIVCGDATLAAWDARRRREAALTGYVRGYLPRQLGARVRVVDARGATLELVADSGAVAAAVRQRLPDVLARLAREGLEFNGIRVRVQVRADAEPTPKPLPNQLDKRDVAPLAALAASLPEGPLRGSIGRLLKRAR